MSQAAATPSTRQRIEITPDLLFVRNQQQLEAWRKSLRYRFLLYGGAAGGGKSFFLRWWCVFYLMVLHHFYKVRRAQVILACEDYPVLADRQVSRIEAEFPKSLGTLADTKKLGLHFRLADKYGGGIILLRNLDDPSKYLSTEFAGVAVDELTRNPEQTFQDLRLRMRWPGVERPVFVGTTNPGGIGHAWVQRYWIKRDFPEEMHEISEEFSFVQAKAEDNPFISKNYVKDMQSLPKKMRQAYLEGRWDLFVGQYFDVFREERHVGKRQGSEIICPVTGNVYRVDHHKVGDKWIYGAWPKWVSCDWGRHHPQATYWHTTAPDGRHITYREWVQDGLTPRMLGEGIVERSVDSEGRPERIQQFFLSPDAFQDRTGDSTIAEQIRDVACRGDRFPNPAEASDDRLGGWELLYSLFENDGLLVASNCVRLIACLPTLIYDDRPGHTEDVKKIDGDDPADSERYGLYSRLGKAQAPVEVRAAALVKDITDPTWRQVELEKFYEKEKKANQPVPLRGRGRRR